MDDDKKIIEFIPREQWEQTLQEKSREGGKMSLPKELSRKRVVSAFMDAFEMVGGTSRLVQWASDDANYGDFLKLYARLLPSQANNELSQDTQTVLKHVLPPSKLDAK